MDPVEQPAYYYTPQHVSSDNPPGANQPEGGFTLPVPVTNDREGWRENDDVSKERHPLADHVVETAYKQSEKGVDGSKGVLSEDYHDADGTAKDAGPSTDQPAATLGLPPPFTHHVSEMRIRGDGHVISHDAHLNEDGEALHQFLLEQAAYPPTLLIECKGTHQETRTRLVTRTSNDRTWTETETYQETITDFSFVINATQHILSEPQGPVIYTVGDRFATYRGQPVKQVDCALPEPPRGVPRDEESAWNNNPLQVNTPNGVQFRRRATDEEADYAKNRGTQNRTLGLPPWILLEAPNEFFGMQASLNSEELRWRFENAAHCPSVTRIADGPNQLSIPTKTLRQWADEYCASGKMLKEFNFHKTVHGWNFTELEQAIRNTILLNWTRPGHQTHVQIKLQSDVVSIRPDNWLSRMLSRRLVKFFLWVFLIYPLIIWPFKRFGNGGGGEWRVAGAAYALAKWTHLEDSRPGETADQYGQRSPKIPSLRALRTTSRGVSRLDGLRDGEWFRQWEQTIAMFVRERRISSEAVPVPLKGGAAFLDGYSYH